MCIVCTPVNAPSSLHVCASLVVCSCRAPTARRRSRWPRSRAPCCERRVRWPSTAALARRSSARFRAPGSSSEPTKSQRPPSETPGGSSEHGNDSIYFFRAPGSSLEPTKSQKRPSETLGGSSVHGNDSVLYRAAEPDSLFAVFMFGLVI